MTARKKNNTEIAKLAVFNININLSCDPEISFLDIYPSESKIYFHKKTYKKDNSSFMHNIQELETNKNSVDKEWINHLFIMKYYLAIKMNEQLIYTIR